MPSDEWITKKKGTSLFKLCKKKFVNHLERIINKILRTLLNDLLDADPACSTRRLEFDQTLRRAREKYANEVTTFGNLWSELPLLQLWNFSKKFFVRRYFFFWIRKKKKKRTLPFQLFFRRNERRWNIFNLTSLSTDRIEKEEKNYWKLLIR